MSEKVKVLLVDDESHIRIFMRKVLQSMNCDVIAEAADGNEAITMYRRYKPNITLMDINMRSMNGAKALKIIVQEDPSALVIMLTSLHSMEKVNECLSSGASNYLRKDLPIKEIKQQIIHTWHSHNNRTKH